MADVIANCTYSDNFHAVVDRIAVLGGLLERFWPGGDRSED